MWPLALRLLMWNILRKYGTSHLYLRPDFSQIPSFILFSFLMYDILSLSFCVWLFWYEVEIWNEGDAWERKMERQIEEEEEGAERERSWIVPWHPILYHSDPSLALIDGVITIWVWAIYIRRPQLFTAKHVSLNWPPKRIVKHVVATRTSKEEFPVRI